MDLELRGKRALVAASSRGLGLACAQRLASEGCRVALHARDEKALIGAREVIVQESGQAALTFIADLGQAADIRSLARDVLSSFGGLDVLVLNTGHMPYGAIEELSDDEWEHAFNLAIMSAIRLVRDLLPALRESRGSIVFISSSTAKEPKPHHVVSNVMRAGVAGFAKTLAKALVKDGVRVNTVAPGLFDSGRVAQRITEKANAGALDRTAAALELFGPLAMDRVGRPYELADAVAFLASPRAAFITGVTVAVDGGSSQAIF
jgi:3-oxoacyl-[acyl-carrier protein] reductase